MSALESTVLYERLPAVYRELDAGANYPLRALLGVISEQAALLEGDVEQLWDDFFVETARPWVVPYIAELVGNESPKAIFGPVTSRQREFIARLAARLGVGLAADSVGFELTGDQHVTLASSFPA